MIKTSHWFQPLPPDHLRIGISRGVPRRGVPAGYRLFRKLAPDETAWAAKNDQAVFIEAYKRQLSALSPRQVAAELEAMAAGKTAVLVCWEHPNRPPTWCHRCLAAAWLAKALGEAVPEVGFENLPQHLHPLRPPGPRRPAADPLARYVWPTPRRLL